MPLDAGVILCRCRFSCKSLTINRAGVEGARRPLTFLPPGGHNFPVIICTKCGAKNSDDTLACARCGNKLQSPRRACADPAPADAPLEPFRGQRLSPDLLRSLRRMLEAWVYVLVLGGVAAACLSYRVWWPLYPTVAGMALLLWLRRV